MADTKSNARIQTWTQVPEKCVHDLLDFEQADRIRQEKLAEFKETGIGYQVKVRKYPLHAQNDAKLTFSVLVFKRINRAVNPPAIAGGSDSYTIDMSKNNELCTSKRPPIAGIVDSQDLDPSNLTAEHYLKDKEQKPRSKKERRAARRAVKGGVS